MKRIAAVSYQNKEIIEELKKYDLDPIEVFPYNNNKNIAESSHADMQILSLPYNEVFLINGNEPFNSMIIDRIYDRTKIKYTKKTIGTFKYPDCVLLNAAIVGKNVLCNTKYTDDDLLQDLRAHDYNIVHVNQGYTKCSCAVVDDNAIITADKGIAAAAASCGIEVLVISPFGIQLCEKYEGFIGGASFKMSDRKLIFIGNIDLHSDADRIKSFCRSHNIETEILCQQLPLTDIGGVVIC